MAMTRTQFLLCKLAEEASEIAQIALKAQQFGLDEVMPGQPLTNAERTYEELDDLFAIVGLLMNESDFSYVGSKERQQAKHARVIKYSNISVALGMIECHRTSDESMAKSLDIRDAQIITLREEIARLREYEWMYNELSK